MEKRACSTQEKAIVEGRLDPGHVRYDWLRRGIDRTLKTLGIDTDGPEAVEARAEPRNELDSFEAIEGRAPVGADLKEIARRAVDARVTDAAGPQADESAPAEESPPQGPEAKNVFGPGAEPSVVHNDDGSAEVTAGKIPTPGGPALRSGQIPLSVRLMIGASRCY